MNSELALWNVKWDPIFQSASDVLDAQKKLFQSKAEEILEDSIEGQRLRFLENEIHKTNLKLMEGKSGQPYWASTSVSPIQCIAKMDSKAI